MGRFINADAFVSTGQGLLGNNMFAYCRNNPVFRKDAAGTEDVIAYNDGELLSSDELEDRGGGGSSGSWSMFLQCIDDAAAGLNAAMGARNFSVSERHHIFSNKSARYTPQYQEITDRYNYSLSQQENITELQGHRGRHTNAYHEFMLTTLNALDNYAGGNSAAFYEGIKYITEYIQNNSWLPYARKGDK